MSNYFILTFIFQKCNQSQNSTIKYFYLLEHHTKYQQTSINNLLKSLITLITEQLNKIQSTNIHQTKLKQHVAKIIKLKFIQLSQINSSLPIILLQIMGGCQSATDQVSNPQPVQQKKFKALQKQTFVVPKFNKIDVATSNGKITDYIANNLPVGNEYQKINVQDYLVNNKFVDSKFPTIKQSIGPQPMAQNIQWKRPSEFLKGKFSIFEGNIQPSDIKQGKLGDCYLLSSLAAISQCPFVIKRIFETTQQSTFGYYGVWLFVDGLWRCIVIDDYFPLYNGKPIFSRNHNNQLWVMLLEKAYAKVFGNYQAIQSGLTGIAMNAITGAPYQYLCKDSNTKVQINATWQFIKKHMDLNNFLTGSTQNNNRNQYLGLVSTHAYTIIDAQEVYIATKKGKKKQRILKLNNPWGKYQWKGRWSQYSDVWSEQLRQQLKFEKADDGLFWINIQDFVQNFGQVCACNYDKNYISTSLPLKFDLEQQNGYKGIFISTATRTQGFLTVYQKDHRNFHGGNYEYSLARMIVVQIDKITKTLNKYIADIIDCDHDATIEIVLDPGDYYVLVQIDWKCTHSRDAVLQYYGQHPLQMVQDGQLTNVKVQSLFNQIVILHEKNTQRQRIYQYAKDSNITRITGSIAGYVYYHYSNKSKTNNYLCESVILKQKKFIEVYDEKSNNLPVKDQFVVKVFSGQQRIVKLKVQKQGNSFYSFATKIQFYIVEKYSLEKLRQLADKKPTKIKTRQIEGKPIDVKVKTYNYSGGITILYQNKMDKYAYIQQITFDMDNLKLQNQILPKNNKLQIQLQPQSQKMLSFVVESPGKQVVFRTKMSFYLNSPQFKF